jgi:hypothetical protein
MTKAKYSASMVKIPFWFLEFKKMMQLLYSGKNLTEIRDLNREENIFSASSDMRATQVFNNMSSRVKALDPKFVELFQQSDISNQKLIALIAVMESNSLFFDFMYEVFREKLIIGINEITDNDINAFFRNKQTQDERVAQWTDQTFDRLRASFKTYLSEAGVLENTMGRQKILRPLLDQSLEQMLKQCGMGVTLNILTGVR